MSADPTTAYGPRPRLVVVEVGAETVLYDPADHGLHLLDPSSALVWAELDGRSTAEVARHVAAAFPDQPEVEREVKALIGSLLDRGLVVPVVPVARSAGRGPSGRATAPDDRDPASPEGSPPRHAGAHPGLDGDASALPVLVVPQTSCTAAVDRMGWDRVVLAHGRSALVGVRGDGRATTERLVALLGSLAVEGGPPAHAKISVRAPAADRPGDLGLVYDECTIVMRERARDRFWAGVERELAEVLQPLGPDTGRPVEGCVVACGDVALLLPTTVLAHVVRHSSALSRRGAALAARRPVVVAGTDGTFVRWRRGLDGSTDGLPLAAWYVELLGLPATPGGLVVAAGRSATASGHPLRAEDVEVLVRLTEDGLVRVLPDDWDLALLVRR